MNLSAPHADRVTRAVRRGASTTNMLGNYADLLRKIKREAEELEARVKATG